MGENIASSSLCQGLLGKLLAESSSRLNYSSFAHPFYFSKGVKLGSMKIVRFRIDDSLIYGALEDGSERLVALKGDPLFQKAEPSGQLYNLEEARLLSPVIPRSKVVSCFQNRALSCEDGSDADSVGAEITGYPQVAIKPNTAVIGPDDPIAIPAWGGGDTQIFVGLAAVVKTICKNVLSDQLDQVIAGWTIALDCSCGNENLGGCQRRAWDTSAPLGPWIVVDPTFDPDQVTFNAQVDGVEVATANSSGFSYRVGEAFAKVSAMMTLLPGDVVIVGGMYLPEPLHPGQRVQAMVSGIGALENLVVSTSR